MTFFRSVHHELLHLDSSVLGQLSVSRRLSALVVEEWQRRHPGIKVTYRDLVSHPIPALGTDLNGSREPDALGEAVFDGFMAADVIVIGAPMYNFGIPTQLKAWIDRIAIPGKVFRYGANGPEGLAGGKKVIIASSRGGVYSQGPRHRPISRNPICAPYLASSAFATGSLFVPRAWRWERSTRRSPCRLRATRSARFWPRRRDADDVALRDSRKLLL